jgi:hypothetical protein
VVLWAVSAWLLLATVAAGEGPKVGLPSKERAPVGKCSGELGPSVLVCNKGEGGDGWRRLAPADAVYTSDTLMSLPGYASEVRLNSGVRLVLRGLVPEFWRDPVQVGLLETAIVLHQTADFDADLTLDRGRLYITNTKGSGPASVRLRFGKDGAEVWDITLHEPETEVGIDLPKTFVKDVADEGVGPKMRLFFQVLRGRAGARLNKELVTHANLLPPPGAGFFEWDNYRGDIKGPQAIANKEASERIWKKSPPTKMENAQADAMIVATRDLNKRLSTTEPPAPVLDKLLEAEGTAPATRRLAIYAMAGLDDVRGLLEALGDEHEDRTADRDAAVVALRRWLARDPGQARRLYAPKEQTGILRTDALARTYSPKEARTIAELLTYGGEEGQAKETYELLATHLRSSKVAIAELAYYHLRLLAYPVKLPAFNAAWPQDQRKKVSDKVFEMVDRRELPPPPSEVVPPGGKPPAPSKPPR